MPHAPTPRSRAPRVALASSVPRSGPPNRRTIAILALVSLALGACGSSFDPTGPCTADGTTPGAYPELEAVVPTSYAGTAPTRLDSGRTCTAGALGTLASHGIKELRFAGATWATGTDSGLTLAVFVTADGPPLDPAWLAEFYETGARSGKNVQSVDTGEIAIPGGTADGATGRRIDVLNGESFQTVVVWPWHGRVAVTLVADFIREIQTRGAHDKIVLQAVSAYGP